MHLLCVSLSVSLNFQLSALLPEPPSWTPIPENTPPFPCLSPLLCTVQPQASSLRAPGQCLRLPHPQLRTPSLLPPSASWKRAGGCHLGPRPSAPVVLWVLASRTAARSCSGLREQVRAAAAWRAPVPRPGEEGRTPARVGLVCASAPPAPALHSAPAPHRGALPQRASAFARPAEDYSV